MEVVLIFRPLSEMEQASVISKDFSQTQVFYLPGVSVSLTVPTTKIPEGFVTQASIDLINAINSLGDRSINGKSISEILTVEKIPLWHYQRFRLFFLLKREWIINQCIKKYLADNINLECFVPFDAKIYDEGLQNLTIIKDGIGDHTRGYVAEKTKRNYKALFNYIIFFSLRVLIGFLRSNNPLKKTHLVIDRSIRQKCRNINTLEPKLDNYNLSPLFDSNPEGLLIISEVETPKFKSSTPFLIHSYHFNGEGRGERTVYGENILFKGLFSFSIHRKRKQIYNAYLHNAAAVKQFLTELKDPDFAETMNNPGDVNNANVNIRLFSIFMSLHKSSGFYILKYLCYQRFFRKYSFKSISAIDENSPATKCILDAARSLSIKSIGIQHGNIGNAQPAYIYTKRDMRNHVMADMTIVWGHYWAEFLTQQSNYPTDSIKIAGQMRSDLIPAMLRKSVTFRQRLGDNQYLVLFASQPIADVNYRFQIAFDTYKCLSRYPQVKLIQKLHPAERHDVGYYRDIALKAGNRTVDIHYDIDLYEVLAAADIVVTAFSTVGSEAVYFGKPLIIYDPLREDLLKYVQESVAFQATDLDSLNYLVEGLLNSSLRVDKEKYEQFIKKYAYSIDGQATARTNKLIQQL